MSSAASIADIDRRLDEQDQMPPPPICQESRLCFSLCIPSRNRVSTARSKAASSSQGAPCAPCTFPSEAHPCSPSWCRDVARMKDDAIRSRSTDTPPARGLEARPSSAALSVLTWNTQLLPGILKGQAGSGAQLRARAAVIAARLLELGRAGAVDVVLLQEVWHRGSADVLQRALKPVFPHLHAPDAFCGLLTFSRRTHPHTDATFAKFKATEGIEGLWFSKGVSATAIEVPPSRVHDVREDERGEGGDSCRETGKGKRHVFIVLNAHTQSDFWKHGGATRSRQFPVILETMRRCAAEARGGGATVRGAVLCGDLNVEAGSTEYGDMMRAFEGAEDVIPKTYDGDKRFSPGSGTPTFPLGRWSHSLLRPSRCRYVRLTPTKRLDYVLNVTPTLSGGPDGVDDDNGLKQARAANARHAFSHVVIKGLADDHRGDPLSDHAPIVAHLSF